MSDVASKAKVLDMTLEELPQDKLVKLAEIHNDQEERAEALGQSTLDLNAQYIDLMATITKNICEVWWDSQSGGNPLKDQTWPTRSLI